MFYVSCYVTFSTLAGMWVVWAAVNPNECDCSKCANCRDTENNALEVLCELTNWRLGLFVLIISAVALPILLWAISATVYEEFASNTD